jgi:hypothetical protein
MGVKLKKGIVRTIASGIIILAFAVQPSLESNVYGASQFFNDLPANHWAVSQIEEMSNKGILKGYPDQSFKPENPITYGEYIKMATIILDGVDAGNGSGKNWALKYYKKGTENGIYSEYDIPNAKLSWQITRGDMALIISGLLENKTVENFDLIESRIVDIDEKTKHEYEIIKACSAGVLEGYPDGTFRPDATLTRAEAAVSLFRIIKTQSNYGILNNSGNIINKNYNLLNIIGNMEEYRKSDWIETEKFTFVSPDEAGLKIRVPWNGRLAGFDHTLVGFIYLVKDNEIIEYCRSIPAETFITSGSHYRLDTLDYIMCIPSVHGTQKSILLVKNPFGKQV